MFNLALSNKNLAEIDSLPKNRNLRFLISFYHNPVYGLPIFHL